MPNMLSRPDYLLSCLTEECCETGQRATKAMRFGLREIQQGVLVDNATRLLIEYAGLVAVVEVLQSEGHLPHLNLIPLIEDKKLKLEHWWQYSATGKYPDSMNR